eukprot:GILI01009868.1.p1 GENE.GILI01009868.1~~GILI01009868.1.p1  ORF type:complete len:645 (+),score=189.88 GILI01009868.1:137-2071(+)
MSAKMQVPGTTVRQTNVAVVRLTKNGKKLEIACYKNKVINYRSGQETRLDEVLQIERVFNNVAGGDYASNQDIKKCIGVAMEEKAAVKYILDNGELQVAAHEREHEVAVMLRDISNIISQKCVNKANMRPFPPLMIEQAIKTCGATIRLTDPAKKQALLLINKLIESQVIPIDRALMKVRVSDTVSGLHAANAAKEKEKEAAGKEKESTTAAPAKKGGKGGKKGGRGKHNDDDSDSASEDEKKVATKAPPSSKASGKKGGADNDEPSAPTNISNIPEFKELVMKKSKMSVEEKARAFVVIFPRCQIVPDVSSPTSANPPSELNASSSTTGGGHSMLINIEPHLFRDAEALFASVQVIEHAVMDLSGALFAPSGMDFAVAASTATSTGGATSVGHASQSTGITSGGGVASSSAPKSSSKKPAKDEESDSDDGGHGRKGKKKAAKDDSDSDDGGNGRKGNKKKAGKVKAAAAPPVSSKHSKRPVDDHDDESSDEGASYRKATAAKKGAKKPFDEDDDDGSSQTGGTGDRGESKQLTAKERRKQRADRKAEQEAVALQNAESEDDEAAKKGHRKNQKLVAAANEDDEAVESEYDSDDDANRREKKKKDDARKAAEDEAQERLRLDREEAERNGELVDEEEEEAEETH